MEELERLRTLVGELGSVLVAYSGGVDSSLLLAVAHAELGPAAVGAIANSATLPARELSDALDLAAEHGWRVEVVTTHEMDREQYVANGPDRCYHCKDELFSGLTPLRQALGLDWLAYGANLDDSQDHRPGAGAAREHGVRSPLVEAAMGKDAVRAAARAMGLSNWDRPAFACLASRIQYGQAVTLETLDRVGRAEAWLQGQGFRQVRVRVHGARARVEVEPGQVQSLIAEPMHSQMLRALLGCGFLGATVDPQGYRRGSMNLASHGGHRSAG